MSRPDHAGYDPFDDPAPAAGPAHPGPAAGSGTPGFGGGPGYEGYYSDPSRNPHQVRAGGAPAVPTGTGPAIAALILGVLSVPFAFAVFGGLLAILAIILAAVALRTAAKARRLGATQTGGTTAMSVIGILAAILGLVISALVLWAIAMGAGVAAECNHLIGDQAAFDACIQDSVMHRFGLN
ncbi:hypothetical protein ACFORJ_11130 [Corynebacterium hansenii]|uniref:DUF4190 domain-containing protein n=2 Tax=Corynebacterium hansenii TaxID=394964 RepID=A0ABV7ZQ77_9CORY|nr:hypothetical protein CHAN_06180 [Corynebacterium hansenii]